MAPIRDWIDAFNAGHPERASGAFAPDAVIVDEISPYVWRGPHALQWWSADAAKGSTAYGATDLHGTLGEPRWADIKGDDGYIVVPEAMDELVHGKPTCERGLHSFALRKTASGWKITVAAWALSAVEQGACGAP
jgi:ketosteroid isomerase-like protein